jgi:hypothetical protein
MTIAAQDGVTNNAPLLNQRAVAATDYQTTVRRTRDARPVPAECCLSSKGEVDDPFTDRAE